MDAVLLPLKGSKLTIKQVLAFMVKARQTYPASEIFFDGDAYAIVRRG